MSMRSAPALPAPNWRTWRCDRPRQPRRPVPAAAQAWNHAFYWRCLHPRAGGEPYGALADRIARQFGDTQKLREEFSRAALALSGSGWAWLVQHPDGAWPSSPPATPTRH